MTKQCKCGETDLQNFSKNSRHKDGLENLCRKCISERRSKQYVKHKKYYLDKAKEQHKRNRQRGTERHYTINARFTYAKSRATLNEKGWSIPFEEYKILVIKPCYYCNNELAPEKACGVGLDRIDNSKGYEPTNVLPCCGVCNTIRNAYLSVDETKIAVQAVIDYRKSIPNNFSNRP